MNENLPTVEACAPDRRAQRRQAIMEAAAKLFADLGYSSCEMERVTSELGIAKGTLYLYFPGKQELFFACVDLGHEADATGRAAAADSTFGTVRAHRPRYPRLPGVLRTAPALRRIADSRAGDFQGPQAAHLFEYRQANRGKWRQIYVELIAAGRLRADLSPDRIVDTIGALLYGTMFTNHFVGRAVPLDEQARAILEIIFRGLLSDTEDEKTALGRRIWASTPEFRLIFRCIPADRSADRTTHDQAELRRWARTIPDCKATLEMGQPATGPRESIEGMTWCCSCRSSERKRPT